MRKLLGATALGVVSTVAPLVMAAGQSQTHDLDQKIWRIRGDDALKRALRLA